MNAGALNCRKHLQVGICVVTFSSLVTFLRGNENRREDTVG